MKRRAKNINGRTHEPLPVITKQLNEFMFKVNGNLYPGEWTVICSSDGCGEQAPHTDYFRREGDCDDKIEEFGFFLFLATMDNTKLIGYNNNGLKYEINLNAGDLLICREDFIHAGSSYFIFNWRIHGYFDSKKSKLKRIKDTTYLTELDLNAATVSHNKLFDIYIKRKEIAYRSTTKRNEEKKKDKINHVCLMKLKETKTLN